VQVNAIAVGKNASAGCTQHRSVKLKRCCYCVHKCSYHTSSWAGTHETGLLLAAGGGDWLCHMISELGAEHMYTGLTCRNTNTYRSPARHPPAAQDQWGLGRASVWRLVQRCGWLENPGWLAPRSPVPQAKQRILLIQLRSNTTAGCIKLSV